MRSTRLARVCDLCGRIPVRALLASDGRLFCAKHSWCNACAAAHHEPCAEIASRILTDRQASEQASAVLYELQAMGIGLPRVPLSLVSGLPLGVQGQCIKRTVGTSRTATIEIRIGLGPRWFGHSIAHEHTHALIHLSGQQRVDPNLEEGVCEMVAMVWLASRGVSDGAIRRLWRNPHPAYGAQMRSVVRRAKQVGVPTVLTSVLRDGLLP